MKKNQNEPETTENNASEETFNTERPLDSLYEQPQGTMEESQSAPENSDEIVVSAETSQEESHAEAPEGPKQSWKELREKAQRADTLQKERDQYYNVLKQIEEEARYYAQQQPQQTQQREPEEEEFDLNTLDDDEVLTGREMKRALQKESKRLRYIEESINAQRQASTETQIENELKSKYSDFYDVINNDNITKLREMRPGLAKSLSLNPDLREKAMDTYQMIKDLGIYQEDHYAAEREMARKNAAKPRPINSVSPQMGNSPLSKANAFAGGLTDDLKKHLYKEMLEKSKSR